MPNFPPTLPARLIEPSSKRYEGSIERLPTGPLGHLVPTTM